MRSLVLAALAIVAAVGAGMWLSLEASRPVEPVPDPPAEEVDPLDISVKKFTDLMAAEPQIVMLGSAAARTAMHARSITAALDGAKLAPLLTSRSGAPSWAVFLEHRVFLPGHRPTLVLVPDWPVNMLLGGPDGPARRQRLLDHLPEAERADPALALGAAEQQEVGTSKVPTLLSLAKTYGSRILFVELPTPPDMPAVPAERRQALAALVRAEEHAGYLDLSEIELGEDAFNENNVFDSTARTQLTAALLEQLTIEVLDGDAPLPGR